MFKRISPNRIGQELIKGLTGKNPERGIALFQDIGFLNNFLPEVEALVGVEQNEHHLEGCAFTHTLMVLASLPENPSPSLAVAALLHDTGKALTQEPSPTGKGYTFHGHEEVSTRIAEQVFRRLHLSAEGADLEEVLFLVENHMRVRRIPEMKRTKQVALFRSPFFPNLLLLLEADDRGSLPTRDTFTAVKALYEAFLAEGDVSPKVRGITGHMVMERLNLSPGPEVGRILRRMDDLLQDNPSLSIEDLFSLL